MGTADVARLRFVMNADASGLKAGCKEGIGSLKDTDNAFRGFRNRTDNEGIDWKGLKKSARSLKFVGRELGGAFKGGLGDAMGIATTGLAFGLGGAAVAAGALGINLIQRHQEQLEKDRTKAFQDFRGARSKGIDPGTYRTISAIAGDDAKFLDDMAGSMKRLQDAGPNASDSLRKLAEDIKTFGHFTGVDAEDASYRQKQLALSGQKRLANADHRTLGFGDDNRLAVMREKLKISESPMAMLGEMIPIFGDLEKDAKAQALYAPYEAKMQKDERSIMARAEIEGDSSLKTNKEKLTERLSHLDEAKKAGADETLVGRATKEAIDDYRKAQGGPVGMAGAAAAGSEEAYSIVARAQMGAAGAGNDTATTNAILEKQFPDLIQAVKNLNPNWRTADSPT